MKSPKPPTIVPSEIAPSERYFNSRGIMAALAGAAVLTIGQTAAGETAPLKHSKNARFSVSDTPNSRDDRRTYSNFYEFGTDTGDPARLAGLLPVCPSACIGGNLPAHTEERQRFFFAHGHLRLDRLRHVGYRRCRAVHGGAPYND